MKLSHNIAYSSALTICGYLFPLIVYPYISRVLGVTNIGICNFIDGVINYFILFSMMGINIVGIREVAENKRERLGLSQCFSDLIAFNFFLTTIAGIALMTTTFLVPQLYEYKNMLFVGVVKLFANSFLVEWFYKGMEDFRYITLRSILVKSLYVVSVFIFVKTPDDYAIYYLLTVLVLVINAAINWQYLQYHVSFSMKRVRLFRYAKPIMLMGCYCLLTSMYTSFNVIYLGTVAGVTEVGYYTTATKLFSFIIALFTSFTGVMLPRMSVLLSEGKREEFERLTVLSTSVLFKTGFPLIVFTIVFAPQIILWVSGSGYALAVLPMRIVMPLIFVIGYEQIMIVQMLMPMKKDRAVFINSFIGAAVGFLLNLLLVPYLQSMGSAIVWVGAECTVLLSAQYFTYKYLQNSFPFSLLFRELLYGSPVIIILGGLGLLPNSIDNAKMLMSVTVLSVYYVFVFNRFRKKREDMNKS